MSGTLQLLKETFASFSNHKAPKMGAALAYYTVFSLAPMLMIALSIVSLIFDEEAARTQILEQFRTLIGEKGTESIKGILEANAERPAAGVIATIIGFATLLFGASGVFAELQDSLNTIWEVKAAKTNFAGMLKKRTLSFIMVLGTGFLLLSSLLLTAAVAAASEYVSSFVAGFEVVWEVANFSITFAVITLLFAMMFRVLPDIRIAWRDVWVGAVITALLFDVGKFLLGFYLGRSAVASSYGAAGSIIILLLWVFYTAQILFFGAEFTRVYATRCGTHQNRPIRPRREP